MNLPRADQSGYSPRYFRPYFLTKPLFSGLFSAASLVLSSLHLYALPSMVPLNAPTDK